MQQGASGPTQACHTMVCHPARGNHCTASALWLAPGHRQGRPGWGEGSKWPSGRPLQEEGPGQGRKDGRQLGGQELSPSHRGTLAGGWREGGPDGGGGSPCHTNRSQQVRQSQPTSSGISGWWGPAEVTCPGRRTEVTHCPLARPGVASGESLRAGDIALGS